MWTKTLKVMTLLLVCRRWWRVGAAMRAVTCGKNTAVYRLARLAESDVGDARSAVRDARWNRGRRRVPEGRNVSDGRHGGGCQATFGDGSKQTNWYYMGDKYKTIESAQSNCDKSMTWLSPQ